MYGWSDSIGGRQLTVTDPVLHETVDRLNELVRIHTEFFEAEGRIRAVRADGYGIQFFDEVDEDVINRIVEEYGFKVSESFLAKRN